VSQPSLHARVACTYVHFEVWTGVGRAKAGRWAVVGLVILIAYTRLFKAYGDGVKFKKLSTSFRLKYLSSAIQPRPDWTSGEFGERRVRYVFASVFATLITVHTVRKPTAVLCIGLCVCRVVCTGSRAGRCCIGLRWLHRCVVLALSSRALYCRPCRARLRLLAAQTALRTPHAPTPLRLYRVL
jgi:hypothetical protein